MSVLYFLIISYILLSISLYFLFKKVGVNPILGLVPGLNFIEWCKLVGRKPIFALWLLFPIVNIFIFCGLAVDMVRSFKLYKFIHTAGAVIYAPFMFFYLAFNEKIKYDGPTLPKERAYAEQLKEAKEKNDDLLYNRLMRENPYKKSAPREWAESIVFAVFAAAFIRMFLIEAYVIPTPSMEGSLNVGDFLFVSKAHYGIRTPMTVAMVPLLHNVIPGLGTESYLKKPQLPYYRLPAIEEIDRLEPIVFNWPVGDSVFITSARPYSYAQVKQMADNPLNGWGGDPQLKSLWEKQQYRVRPIDKKDHYIKRCVAIAGDTLQIKDSQIYINGEPQNTPSQVQLQTIIKYPQGFNTGAIKRKKFITRDHKMAGENDRLMIAFLTEEEREEIAEMDNSIEVFPFIEMTVNRNQFEETGLIDSFDLVSGQFQPTTIAPNTAYLRVSHEQAEFIRNLPNYSEIKSEENSNPLFPQGTEISKDWTVDNYGPIYIPKKGAEVVITPLNINFYRRIITTYENNDLEIKRGRIYINGEVTTTYTFQQNYYWAMGDNRHNSEDSRVWGYVPEDHIVGKPLFIWFSLENGRLFDGIRFGRIFRKADIR